jgi:rare lipoprotein A
MKTRARRTAALNAAMMLCLLAAGCGRRAAVNVPVIRPGTVEEGVASWYGDPYHGRRAANGEIYDMHAMTAAHPRYPFETWVRVRNETNKKTTEVRITDRGPFAKGRILDLSRAAASEIDMIRAGTAKVRVTVIEAPRSYTAGRQFTVQVSSLFEKARAERLGELLRKEYGQVEVRYRKANPAGGHREAWRVLVGREKSLEKARELQGRLQGRYPHAFVVGWDVE